MPVEDRVKAGEITHPEKHVKTQVYEERDWWRVLADKVGWSVYGWTCYQKATYIDGRGKFIELTHDQRNELLEAMKS